MDSIGDDAAEENEMLDPIQNPARHACRCAGRAECMEEQCDVICLNRYWG